MKTQSNKLNSICFFEMLFIIQRYKGVFPYGRFPWRVHVTHDWWTSRIASRKQVGWRSKHVVVISFYSLGSACWRCRRPLVCYPTKPCRKDLGRHFITSMAKACLCYLMNSNGKRGIGESSHVKKIWDLGWGEGFGKLCVPLEKFWLRLWRRSEAEHWRLLSTSLLCCHDY